MIKMKYFALNSGTSFSVLNLEVFKGLSTGVKVLRLSCYLAKNAMYILDQK